MRTCDECGGSRHRWEDETQSWVACACLKATQTRALYEAAGITTRIAETSWREFMADHRLSDGLGLLDHARRLKAGERHEATILLHGRPLSGPNTAGALLVRSALDGGMTAAITDLPSLIDVEFEKVEKKAREAAAYRGDVLAIVVGDEPPHKWNRHVLEKALRVRWGAKLFTVLVCHGDPGRLASQYQDGKINEALTRFRRVEIGKR